MTTLLAFQPCHFHWLPVEYADLLALALNVVLVLLSLKTTMSSLCQSAWSSLRGTCMPEAYAYVSALRALSLRMPDRTSAMMSRAMHVSDVQDCSSGSSTF